MVGGFITQISAAVAIDVTIPNFEFTLYQDEDELGSEKLEFAHGKLIVLNFWSELCLPCRAEVPSF